MGLRKVLDKNKSAIAAVIFLAKTGFLYDKIVVHEAEQFLETQSVSDTAANNVETEIEKTASM